MPFISSFYSRTIHGLRSVVYETGIAIINYSISIVSSLIGIGLSNAADLYNESAATNPPSAPPLPPTSGCRVFNPLTGLPIIHPNISCVVDTSVATLSSKPDSISGEAIMRSIAVGAAIVVPTAAVLAFITDLIKDSDHLNDLWVNPAKQEPTYKNPIPSQNSRLRSLLKRMWPLLVTYAAAAIGGLILGYTSAEQQWIIFTTTAIGAGITIVAGGGTILGLREGQKKRDRDAARKKLPNPSDSLVVASTVATTMLPSSALTYAWRMPPPANTQLPDAAGHGHAPHLHTAPFTTAPLRMHGSGY